MFDIHNHMLIALEVLYILIAIVVCLKIIYDTENTTKSLAYMLLVVFLPVIGILVYFSVGINYRKRKMYSKKVIADDRLAEVIKKQILEVSGKNIEEAETKGFSGKRLAWLLTNDLISPLMKNNEVKLLINGEEKFPEVLDAIRSAKDHIHIEYYIIEDNEIGKELEKALVEKINEGVMVRLIYDDFGSWPARKTLIRRLKNAGAETFPFSKLHMFAFASRLNYRNHRKIIVIDGKTGFLGGINISDRYINYPEKPDHLYWRDTHLRIDGPGVFYLQYLFLCDWNFCATYPLHPDDIYFPQPCPFLPQGDKYVQIAASGPDSDSPTILYSLLEAIHHANSEILITTPYLIPDRSLLDALVISALSGVKVRILVPKTGDSFLVKTAALAFFEDFLSAGIEIYQYRKGFIHAKTLVVDGKIAMVGTANLDYRSFDLNFEVNAVIYNEDIAQKLTESFHNDLKESEKVDPAAWKERPVFKQLMGKIARLFSPLL
jgi:cardiolipin synthase A/B